MSGDGIHWNFKYKLKTLYIGAKIWAVQLSYKVMRDRWGNRRSKRVPHISKCFFTWILQKQMLSTVLLCCSLCFFNSCKLYFNNSIQLSHLTLLLSYTYCFTHNNHADKHSVWTLVFQCSHFCQTQPELLNKSWHTRGNKPPKPRWPGSRCDTNTYRCVS